MNLTFRSPFSRPAKFLLFIELVAIAAILISSLGLRFYRRTSDVDSVWLDSAIDWLILNGEGNAPAVFSTGLLLCFCLNAFLLQWASTKNRCFWFVTTFVGAYMAADEWFVIHEKLTLLFESATGVAPIVMIEFNWVVLGIPLAIAVALACLFLSGRIERQTRFRLSVAATVFLTGAIGFEIVGSMLWTRQFGTLFVLSVAIEEGLEMLGVAIANAALFDLFIRGRSKHISSKLWSSSAARSGSSSV